MGILDDIQKQEIEYWKYSEAESPREKLALANMINKFYDARIFVRKLKQYNHLFAKANKILEIGAGQGWASCIVKREYPSSAVYTSDISEYAIQSADQWEKVFSANLDRKFACKSYEIPLANQSIDLVFCFQSAHHFIAHRKTLTEVYRVLSLGGTLIYLYEPSCSKLFYQTAYKRINRKRQNVPEDVIVTKKLHSIANEIGFTAEIIRDPSLTDRQFIEQNYYFTLSKISFLQEILPCTTDYLFTKPL